MISPYTCTAICATYEVVSSGNTGQIPYAINREFELLRIQSYNE